MHKLKELRDELIDEAESYVGAIKDGHDDKDALCVKCLASAADHIDAILERHGMLDDGEEEKRSGRRGGMGDRRSYGMTYGMNDTGLEYGNDAGDRVERGRADATSGNDKRAMRELKRIAQDVDNPQLRNAIMAASRMAEPM